MYSPDRQRALEATISCLRDMPLYDQCQKTLVVDGRVNVVPEDWWVVQVPRVYEDFCWSHMWEAGVASARFENILYLDSDRLLPPSYLELVVQQLRPRTFVFTSIHFMMLAELSVPACKKLFTTFEEGGFVSPDFLGVARYEPRFKDPVHGPGKNVMSGSVAFTKDDYYQIGGVDPWYRGHGAYADTDFHFAAQVNGCKFIDLQLPEFHYPHPKKKDEDNLGVMELRRLGLVNYIYYLNKWGLPMNLAENIAVECNLRRPTKYVEKVLKDLKTELGQSPRHTFE